MNDPELTDKTITERLWSIYDNPKDFPGRHVVREWVVFSDGSSAAATEALAVVDTLEQARAEIPESATHLCRFPGDDHCIVETWHAPTPEAS